MHLGELSNFSTRTSTILQLWLLVLDELDRTIDLSAL